VNPQKNPPHSPRPPHPLDDLAAYALDALDDAERRAVDAHLAGCAVCRAELAGHHEALAALASDEAPPASVWQRIAADIGAPDLADPTSRPAAPADSDSSVVPFRAPAARETARETSRETGRPAHAAGRARRDGRSRWMTAAASAVAAAAAVVAAFGFATQGSDGADTVSELAQRAEEQGDTLGTLQSPDGQPAARVVADGGESYVVLDGLGPLPEGQAYQLWSTDGRQPVSLGVLGDGETDAVAVSVPPDARALAISEEVSTGAATPTTVVASGEITRS
jgi:Anti-sigma-K factor rskA/Putative zinc-finger